MNKYLGKEQIFLSGLSREKDHPLEKKRVLSRIVEKGYVSALLEMGISPKILVSLNPMTRWKRRKVAIGCLKFLAEKRRYEELVDFRRVIAGFGLGDQLFYLTIFGHCARLGYEVPPSSLGAPPWLIRKYEDERKAWILPLSQVDWKKHPLVFLKRGGVFEKEQIRKIGEEAKMLLVKRGLEGYPSRFMESDTFSAATKEWRCEHEDEWEKGAYARHIRTFGNKIFYCPLLVEVVRERKYSYGFFEDLIDCEDVFMRLVSEERESFRANPKIYTWMEKTDDVNMLTCLLLSGLCTAKEIKRVISNLTIEKAVELVVNEVIDIRTVQEVIEEKLAQHRLF